MSKYAKITVNILEPLSQERAVNLELAIQGAIQRYGAATRIHSTMTKRTRRTRGHAINFVRGWP